MSDCFKEFTINSAAKIVCRNPEHLPQVVDLLANSLPKEQLATMTVDNLVSHWWKQQLFLSIDTTVNLH